MLQEEPKNASATESVQPIEFEEEAESPESPFDSKSRIFKQLMADLARFAQHEGVTIVFEGETGTGKNFLARLAHQLSPRHAREMHTISLAGLSHSLIASELFGHERGAFTDARTKRLGAFLTAHKSTLFIDEINKASITVQGHLLRALDERKITPVGSDRELVVDVRILTASSENLRSLVDQGKFLPDLYARLGQFTIHVPALRERREDIPGLARFFLCKYGATLKHKPGTLTIHPELVQALKDADWEYNVRELEHVMHRLLVQAHPVTELTLEHCIGDLARLRAEGPVQPTKISTEQLADAVERAKSKAAAARDLDISRSTLYRKLAAADDGACTDGSVSA